MTNEHILKELRKEIADLRREVREAGSRVQYIPQPYPVYVQPYQQYPYYPYYPYYQQPWYLNGTLNVQGLNVQGSITGNAGTTGLSASFAGVDSSTVWQGAP